MIVKICCLSHVLVSTLNWFNFMTLLSYIQEEVITFFYVDLQWNPRTTITFGFAAKKEGDNHSFKLLMIPTELMLCFETQFQTLLCGLIGLPLSNGVLPQSPMHTKSLAVLKKQLIR
ncbi:hypothetical protein P8452_47416 [Trifolium repens]|nr:hypothetical protein P8452_47416 [Trifolium repens]